jgi:FkbM family methyltransferase
VPSASAKEVDRLSARATHLDFDTKYKTTYCISHALRDEQVRIATRKVQGRIEGVTETRQEPIAVVGYGPSLRDTWEKIKDFDYVITSSGSHKFLLEKGLDPKAFKNWWHVEVDPREHKVELLGKPHSDIIYLPASTCHPKYFDHLAGYQVKLWHVFSNEEEALRILPREEWALTGGPDVGMRAMTIARFFGFLNLHVFGIDGCVNGTSHAADHPNSMKKVLPVDYKGKTYQTTPALLECAKAMTHELNALPDVKAAFYGAGLVQAMVEHYEPKPKVKPALAVIKPELISRDYVALNKQLHEDRPDYGIGGGKYVDTILQMAAGIQTTSVLDYGCGKGHLAKGLPFPIWEYDPAIPGKDELPRPADLVVCTDVLEHIEPQNIKHVLDDLRRVTRKVGYYVIHTGPARKTLADGRNAHLIQQKRGWWEKTLSEFFDLAQVNEVGPELHVIVGPRTLKNSDGHQVKAIERNGTKALFVAKNDTVDWRIKTLLTKEPITIQWVENMLPGEKLFDVGANIGGYAIWAAQRGVDVTAFEPEAQNYAALCENIAVNGRTNIRAYPLAVAAHEGLDTLYLSQVQTGGSCHSIGQAVGPDLQERKGIPQGAIATRLDVMAAKVGVPDHIKIDVDGLEHRVIEGAGSLLENPALKSILVETNTNLPEHKAMSELIAAKGFHADAEQVDSAMRKEGSFKGCAEMLFRRLSPVERHVLDAIEAAPVIMQPYPHLYVPGVFTDAFYAGLLAALSAVEYKPIAEVRDSIKGYPNRLMGVNLSRFWQHLNQWMVAGSLRYALLRKFGLPHADTRDETLLLHDKTGYALGPHTDAQFKVLSAVFYLAKTAEQGHMGTALYVPKDATFRCPGGPHHERDKFEHVNTAAYAPNSLFVFAKTDNSFHGVELTEADRDVLIYDVRKA